MNQGRCTKHIDHKGMLESADGNKDWFQHNPVRAGVIFTTLSKHHFGPFITAHFDMLSISTNGTVYNQESSLSMWQPFRLVVKVLHDAYNLSFFENGCILYVNVHGVKLTSYFLLIRPCLFFSFF